MKLLTFILLFGLLAVFLVHNFDSIGQDIGRHLKTGEIIWETKSVPTTNLFSFTEPDFPFTNHHWLSEVIFYGGYNLGGFTGLILLKIFVVLATFILLLLTIKPLWIIDLRSRLSTGVRVGFWPIIVSFVLSIFIFISRTEVRPEIFSFLILAFFLSALFKAKYELTTSEVRGTPDVKTPSWLWFLPLAQLLWVNLHIYFFIGPILFLAFFIDRLFDPIIRNTKYVIQKLLLVGGLIGLATLINPAGIQGALLPFNILKEYGYSIVENQTLAFLADLFGFNLSIFIFKISTAVLVVSFLLTVQKPGFWRQAEARLQWAAKMLLVVFLVFIIFFVASGGYYKWARLSKTFGFSVPDGLERAASFVKKNNIEGPMFNNFDIGGYLIWKLSEHKVFVDNRPEAYSVQFFSEVYKPMQENEKRWDEFSEKYGINFIFFGHTDATPWGQTFLKNIIKNPSWKVVFFNENAIILVKNITKNEPIFSKYKYELAE